MGDSVRGQRWLRGLKAMQTYINTWFSRSRSADCAFFFDARASRNISRARWEGSWLGGMRTWQAQRAGQQMTGCSDRLVAEWSLVHS